LNVLLIPFGSHGDVHPFVGLGLEYVELGTAEEFLGLAERPEVWHPRRAFGLIFREGVAQILERQYELVAERCARGDTLVVANAFGFAARTAQEKLGVPLVTVHLQPAVLWSVYESPVLPGGDFRRLPRWLKRSLFRLGEALFIDRPCLDVFDAFRAGHGLPPVRRLARWWNSPECVLGLFPAWYGPPQPDWPPQVCLTQFPLWDEATLQAPSPEVEAFLEAGDPPLVFAPGSANTQASAFFRAAVDACRLLGRRGMLLTRFAEQVPRELPPHVRHFEYVPFSQVLPRSAAVVHHGGIGSTSQALRAGVPQLVMPMAHDQPDNAARVVRLGVGAWLPRAKFQGPEVARKLMALLGSANLRTRCQEVAARFVGVDPFDEACRVIERYGRQRGDLVATINAN
jgi:UDP:flavonoid glycosyltransferase YjiC (YdhE family)